MNKRLVGVSAALLLALAGCGGRNPVGSEDAASKPETPPVTPPASPPGDTPAQQPGPSFDLQALKTDVTNAYSKVTTIRGDYVKRQTRGSGSYYAKVRMTFAKPRKLRLDIKESSDSLLNGAIVVWLGGSTLRGRKDIGFIPIKQEHRLSDKPDLRGWLYNQTDYEAMVQSALAGIPAAKYLGNSRLEGANVMMVEFKSKLPGVSFERIGIDSARKLPVYREFRESAGGQPVTTITYTNLALNSPVSGSAFDI